MKQLMIGAVAVFIVGCAGSQPRVVFRSAEVPSQPDAERSPSPIASAPATRGVVARAVAVRREAAPAAAPMEVAPPAPDPLAEECSHMLLHIGQAQQLFETRFEGASEASQARALSTFFGEMAELDATHPSCTTTFS